VKASSNGMTVLVVEDDWLVREDIVLSLQQEGWIVLESATGAAALKALRQAGIVDLLITLLVSPTPSPAGMSQTPSALPARSPR
jgi:CheY-like chemotaxis protein